MARQGAATNNGKRRHRQEGKQKHVIAFLFSMILTLIAFVTVAAGKQINPTFTIILLLVMAVMQVVIQMSYWMHMKDKGHTLPIAFMIGGGIVAFTAIIASIYWTWL